VCVLGGSCWALGIPDPPQQGWLQQPIMAGFNSLSLLQVLNPVPYFETPVM
jgi:hypothetical protein